MFYYLLRTRQSVRKEAIKVARALFFIVFIKFRKTLNQQPSCGNAPYLNLL
ncbi:hypothetical protein THF1A12_10475 [Vibrio jasicida]|uniref:Uncharacterized protein n=1 Tax=Vibrio jasicida TaxID=766224 RepID=A0AAU9QEC5_9VIBR|nr:hypothetical protein THF1A12_10475 [Vibrio jasicida]